MPFDILDTISIPGDPLKPNDDAFGHADNAAVVIDGATSLGDPLMPGESDAAWLAHFGARRLIAHVKDGDGPRDALRHALADAEKSFLALRKRAPKENWEIPLGSMAFAYETKGGFDWLWFGDCAALVQRPGAPIEILGDSFESKGREAERARKLAKETGLAPASGANRPEYLPALRKARNRANTGKHWAFSPDPRAADFVGSARVTAPRGTHALLASDGFLALVTDYERYTPDTLMDRAIAKGLGILADELREIEDADPQGHKHPRFKKSDDATALLLKLV
ncbi:MAG: protein phosphatase 2C domain-containing protein [Alphaproteobacteria bacterium]|nr:protein phosphatase 2C domain-containing protein [Alphaproteobacteria bacterium]